MLGEARANRAHFGHQPVCEVGIYFSARTRDWLGRDKPATYFQSVHLVAYNATPQTTPAKERPYVLPGLIEAAPMFRANIQCRY